MPDVDYQFGVANNVRVPFMGTRNNHHEKGTHKGCPNSATMMPQQKRGSHEDCPYEFIWNQLFKSQIQT